MNMVLTAILGVISLCGQWQYRCTSPEGEWRNGTVPGCVHTDLMAENIIPDPFVGDNEKCIQWVGEKDWEYRREFTVSAADLANSHVEMVFEGIDTYATVYVNDVEVLRADNMFRTWKVDVKDILVAGTNTVRVAFDSVFKIDIPKYLAAPYRLMACANNDQSDIWISVYARKAGYNYGWDWGPRIITSGLWKPLYIETWSDLKTEPSQVSTLAIDARGAAMKADVNVLCDAAGTYVVEISNEGRILYKGRHELSAGRNTVACNFNIRKPELWWTRGLGGQKIYDFDISVSRGGLRSSHTEHCGIRTLETVREKDEYGTSFYIRLNGVPVFMKGANWIPQDNFPARVARERYETAIDDAVRANMNMLRVWGGGFYECDDFYDACDRAGVLVWQDMTFACGMFPYDEAYLGNVEAEVRDNVRRLRNHPSLALWCGNNENEEGYYGWGWRRALSDEHREQHDAGMHRLFHEVIPSAIADEDPTRYYHFSSPSAGYNGVPLSDGDSHYWAVWKGAPVEEYLNPAHIARFMSEYGFQSYPAMATIESYTSPRDRYVGSPVMLAHQKAHNDNTGDPNFADNMMHMYMEHSYRIPAEFRDYIYMGQFQQAEAVKVAMEAHRRAKPYCMGTLFWQINDCWPVASWSSVDYYGRWKPLQFYARRAYADVLVSPYKVEDKLRIKVISDLPAKTVGVLRLRVMDFAGNVTQDSSQSVCIDGYACTDAMEIFLSEIPDGSFVYVTLSGKGGTLSDNLWFPEYPNHYNFTKAAPSITAGKCAGGVELTIKSDKLVRGLMLYSGSDEDIFEDNCIDIVPGIEKKIKVKTSSSPEALSGRISYMSLNDMML